MYPNLQNYTFLYTFLKATVMTCFSHNKPTFVLRGQNPLHCLGQYGKETAAAIYDLFMECMPKFPIDKPDSNGNSGRYI